MLHIALHFLVPLLAARYAFYSRFTVAYLTMIATMVIDLDHLLADPIYDPNRCSIGFHPLHDLIPISIYVALLFVPKCRIIGAGLCLHILLDTLDCARL
ncbi:MAG: DUF6122 family protein [Proteobacteria bacterium]|nr:DUF6122 family protein [Pseudomonadota bacterium]